LSVEPSNDDLWSPTDLELAVKNGDEAEAVRLIESGVDVSVGINPRDDPHDFDDDNQMDISDDGDHDDDDDDDGDEIIFDYFGEGFLFDSGFISDNATDDDYGSEISTADSDGTVEADLDEYETTTTYLHRAVSKNLIRVATALLEKDTSLALRVDPVRPRAASYILSLLCIASSQFPML
jgi:hypothetical protein